MAERFGVAFEFEGDDLLRGAADAEEAIKNLTRTLKRAARDINTSTLTGEGFTGVAKRIAASLPSLAKLVDSTGKVTLTSRQLNEEYKAQLEFLKLIKEEIADRVALEKASAISSAKGTSELAKLAAEAEKVAIQARRSQRDVGAIALGADPKVLRDIRNASVDLSALSTKDLEKNEAAVKLNELKTAELKDQLAFQRAQAVLDDQSTTQHQRKLALLQQESIELRRANRNAIARQAGIDPEDLRPFRRTPITPEDLGQKKRALDELGVIKLITDEQRDRIKLERAELVINSAQSTELQKHLAVEEKLAILVRQRARDSLVAGTGAEPRLAAARAVPITPIDLGEKQITAQQKQLEINKIITAEINDRIATQKIFNTLQNKSIQGTLEEVRLRNELNSIGQREVERERRLVELGGQKALLASIRSAPVGAFDLGQVPLQFLDQAAEKNKIIQQEIADRVRLEQLSIANNNRILTQLEQESLAAERLAIAIRQGQRTQRFGTLGGSTQELDDIRKASVDLVALANQGLNPLERQLQIHNLINEELADRVRETKLVQKLSDSNITQLERERALQEQAALDVRRQQRRTQFAGLGGDLTELDRARNIQLSIADIGIRQSATLQRQVELQNLLGQELADTLELARQQQIVASKTSTEFQRQAAANAVNQINLRRQQRAPSIFAAGGSQKEIDDVRTLTVSLKDLQREIEKTNVKTQQGSIFTQAWAVALGTMAANAVRSLSAALRTNAAQIAETVTFFEQLELSTEFYAARALKAEGVSIDYAQALTLVAKEAEGTLIWLQQLAVTSPFTTREVGVLFRTAQAYGLLRKEALILTPLLLDFAAAAGLDSQVLERLALAIGQVRSRGKLTGEEVRQLGNSGIPIRDILVKGLDIANSEFDELLENGKLTSDVVIPAIIEGLKEFEGAGRRVAFETLGGIISAFKEIRQIATFQFFKGVVAPIKDQFLDLFQTLNNQSVFANLRVLGEVVGRHLAAAFRELGKQITVAIDAWRNLDPAVKQQIATFVIATAAVGALALVGGILIGVIKLLTSRFALLATAVALFVTGWTNGWKSVVNVITGAGKSIAGVVRGIGEILSALFTAPRSAKEIQAELMDTLSGTSSAAEAEARKTSEAVKKETSGNALIAGKLSGENFFKGWQIPNPARKISEEMAELFRQLAGGPQLSKSGAEAFGRFLSGFKDADFGFLNQIGSTISQFLSTRVSLGEIVDAEVPRNLFAFREAMAGALKDFRAFGTIGERTLRNVARASGELGGDTVALLKSYTQLAAQSDIVEAAQKKLNDITDRYKAIITPIRKELERISELRQVASEDREIRSLRRIIANEAATDARKREAELQIQEILTNRQVRNLEKQRDTETDATQETLTAAEKRQEEFQKEFDLLKAQIDARLEQLNIVAQEREITTRLQKEIDELRKREKTDLELQVELMGLINDEIKAQVEEAKARFILNKADATELERQQAALTLANAEIERQARIAKAVELGFSEEEITRLKDLPITLKDIGENVDEAFAGADGAINDLTDVELPNLIELADGWREAILKGKEAWIETKNTMLTSFQEINDNLPSFLKILPEGEGGEIPLVKNLGSITLAAITLATILGAATTINAFANFMGFLRAIGVIKGGAAAAGAAGTFVGAGAILSTLSTVALSILGIATAAEIGAQAAGALVGWLQKLGVLDIENVLPAAPDGANVDGRKLTSNINDAIDRVVEIRPEKAGAATDFLAEQIRTIVQNGFDRGLADEQILSSVQTFVNGSFGIAFSFTPENQAKIVEYIDAIRAELEVQAPKVDMAAFIAQKIEDQIPVLAGTVSTSTVAAFDQMSKDKTSEKQVADLFGTAVTNAMNLGLSPISTGILLKNTFDAGIRAGLIPDSPAAKRAFNEYSQGVVSQLNKAFESESPSKLLQREVGIPLGQGIIKGVEVTLPLIAKSKIVASFVTTMQQRFERVRLDAEEEFDLMHVNLTETFDAMRGELNTSMDTLETALITNGFAAIRTAAETEMSNLRTNVVLELTGDTDSMLSDLRDKLLGAAGSDPKTSPAYELGKNFLMGMVKGVEDTSFELSDAVANALADALEAGATELRAESPSVEAAKQLGEPFGLGIAKGIHDTLREVIASVRTMLESVLTMSMRDMFESMRYSAIPQSIQNHSSTVNYNLSLQTLRTTQSVATSFAQMRLMSR